MEDEPFPYMDEKRSSLLFKNLPLQTPTAPLVHCVWATKEKAKKKKKKGGEEKKKTMGKKIIKQPPKKRAQWGLILW